MFFWRPQITPYEEVPPGKEVDPYTEVPPGTMLMTANVIPVAIPIQIPQYVKVGNALDYRIVTPIYLMKKKLSNQ